ncbi:hypothetical protein O181_002570 [Austropuccinia psidii MF-1]|uniref:Uncharacterized protein n=1 Tax=Austropuccinia psidii MF-1 TaxID=1389203 RepID=A0A9Q3BD99_9BASI|nr:hypothetical protein [Austropuccinia psidii MF-1]
MPEAEITDNGSREGKDSVISVSLELLTRDYGRRRIQAVRLCTSRLKKSSMMWGHNSFKASSRSSMWGSKALLGPNQQSRTSPSALGKSSLLIVLGHPHWAQLI